MIVESDIEFEGIPVHIWEGGDGFPILLIHGSGPGASTMGNWRLILDSLAERYQILAVDLIGFGLSGRKSTTPYFDLELWYRQAHAMLERLPGEQVGVLGHSISGSIAMRLAAEVPRVTKVMTTGCMGVSYKANEDTVRCWTFPETRDDLRRAGECLVYDKSVIPDEYIDGRMSVLHSSGYPEYFRSMFAGDKQPYIDAAALEPELLKKIRCDVLMVHGRDDLPFPYEHTTQILARAVPQADVVVLAQCGHSPAVEHSDKLLRLAEMLFG